MVPCSTGTTSFNFVPQGAGVTNAYWNMTKRATVAGSYVLSVTLNGQQVQGTAGYFDQIIPAAAHESNSISSMIVGRTPLAGTAENFEVRAFDQFGNARVTPNDAGAANVFTVCTSCLTGLWLVGWLGGCVHSPLHCVCGWLRAGANHASRRRCGRSGGRLQHRRSGVQRRYRSVLVRVQHAERRTLRRHLPMPTGTFNERAAAAAVVLCLALLCFAVLWVAVACADHRSSVLWAVGCVLRGVV